jgi:hypothetical protein
MLSFLQQLREAVGPGKSNRSHGVSFGFDYGDAA